MERILRCPYFVAVLVRLLIFEGFDTTGHGRLPLDLHSNYFNEILYELGVLGFWGGKDSGPSL